MKTAALLACLCFATLLTAGCARPHEDSYRGRREKSFLWAWNNILDREKPAEAAEAARKVGDVWAGDPEEAQRTTLRVLEID